MTAAAARSCCSAGFAFALAAASPCTCGNVWNLERQSQGDVRISGRVCDRFARGRLRVERVYEGCKSGPITWSARRR